MIINLFTVGESTDINTWSNLPYFFSKAFIDEGAVVNRINIQPNRSIRRIYKYSLGVIQRLLFRLIGIQYEFDYYRSYINYLLTNRMIKENCIRYRNADCNIFLTYSFSSIAYSKLPVIHYCDQIYEEVLKSRNIQPNVFHKRIIKREIEFIRRADFVYSTEHNTIELLKTNYQISNCKELGFKIALDKTKINVDPQEIINLKRNNFQILFVGKTFYERGVDILIEAFKIFNEKSETKFNLCIIGPVSKQVRKIKMQNVILFDYLDKSIDSELEEYINQFKKSRLFVYPMRYGPVPGSHFEASYFCTPSIITNISSINLEIKNLETGVLIDKLDPETFAEAMLQLVNDDNLWSTIAINAHNHVMRYTIESVINTIIAEINNHKIKLDSFNLSES